MPIEGDLPRPEARRVPDPRPWLVWLAASCGLGQRVAPLGDLALESGQVLRSCRVGYRTFGRLDAARSNAVLLIPWFLGRSSDLTFQVGRGRLIDSSRYFVVAVDPLGGGVSTSPSNSETQPGARFPVCSVRDLVEAQHRVLTRVLGIDHLRAVVGISFGGMQVFQWMTAYPDFMEKAVAIAGSPRLPAAERRRWLEGADAALAGSRLRRAAEAGWRRQPLGALRALRDDPLDVAKQAQALASTDVTAPFGGALDRAAAVVRTRALVVVPGRDETVDPSPALEFARLAGARLMSLDGRWGHDAPAREKATLWPEVARFLAE